MAILPFANAPGSSGGGGGTVTSVSIVTANGVSGSVANSTTTPAITLTLGAITPSSVNSIALSGSSTPTLAVAGTSSITGSNTGDQTITLTSDVTGSGTGSFATTIKSSVALSGNPTTTTQTPADNSTKIATTAYVDNAVLGQNFKEAVGAATTANLVGVYLNGSSGVGATFTYTATGVDTIDGVSLTLGMRVLVKNQTTTFQNGIYTVTTAGALGVAGILTRATDSNQSNEWHTGDSVFVTAGTTQSTTTWAYTGIDNPTIGTDAITFAQTAGQGSFTAGNGISITGNSIAIDTSITVDKTTAQTLTNKTLTSPILTTPTLGTPASGIATNLTGTASGLTAGNVTTNANLTGPITSSGNATSIASQTGTGTKFVVDTSPILVTPTIGVATATSINKVAITAPATSATLTIANGKTLTVNNSLTLAGTDSTTMTFPATSASIARIDAAQTFTGVQTFSSAPVFSSITNTGALTLPTSTDTLVGKATTDTFTNKTITATSNSVSYATFTNPYKFLAYRSSAQSTGNGAFAIINFDTKLYDTGSNFDVTTNVGRFTAPVAGFYHFEAMANIIGNSTDLLINLYKNGSNYAYGTRGSANATGSGNEGMNISITVQASAGDYFEIYTFCNSTHSYDVGSAPIKTWFSGYFVSVT